MAKMKAVDAAVRVLELEGVTMAFGVPGAAINPFYAAMRPRNSIRHILARHVEGASHMADGYTRAKAGNIGVCIGTSGPAGTDMITGLYSAWADSVPILCITGQAPARGCTRRIFRRSISRASPRPSASGRSIAVLMDLQGPKLRVGAFARGRVTLHAGAAFRLDLDTAAPGDERRVGMPYPEV